MRVTKVHTIISILSFAALAICLVVRDTWVSFALIVACLLIALALLGGNISHLELFLTSISDYVDLPEIADGYWMLVDRNPGTQKYTNVSFCIYDTAEEVAYMITMDS